MVWRIPTTFSLNDVLTHFIDNLCGMAYFLFYDKQKTICTSMFRLLAVEQGNVFIVLNAEHISLFPEHSVVFVSRSCFTSEAGQLWQPLLWQSGDLPCWTVGDSVWRFLGPERCQCGVQTAGLWLGSFSTAKCCFWTGQWTHLVGRRHLFRKGTIDNRLQTSRVRGPQLWTQWRCKCCLWM